MCLKSKLYLRLKEVSVEQMGASAGEAAEVSQQVGKTGNRANT